MRSGTVADCVCSPAVDLQLLGVYEACSLHATLQRLWILSNRILNFDNSERADKQIS